MTKHSEITCKCEKGEAGWVAVGRQGSFHVLPWATGPYKRHLNKNIFLPILPVRGPSVLQMYL